MRRPATNSVIRRTLRPVIVTRNARVPQRVWVRRRAVAAAACVPATCVVGWFAFGAGCVAGAAGVCCVTGWPATLLLSFGGVTQTPFCSTCGAVQTGWLLLSQAGLAGGPGKGWVVVWRGGLAGGREGR